MEKIESISGNKAEIIKEELEHLLWARDECIDELPEERLDTSHENYTLYKCRNNWFAGVRNSIWRLINKDIIKDKNIIEKFDEFHEFLKIDKIDRFTTKEDIEKANNLLKIVIEHLEKLSINN